MDILSDVLRHVRMNAAVFFDVHGGGDLVATTPPMSEVKDAVMPGAEHVIPFHIMLEGQCFVETLDESHGPVDFRPGDTVLYPQGHGHIMVSNLGDRAEPDLTNYDRSKYERIPVDCMLFTGEEGGPTMHFVCGYLACDAAPFNPLLESLPSQIVAPRGEDEAVEIQLIAGALKEAHSGSAGSETMLARLSELLFLRVLRRYIESLPEEATGWLAGLRDPMVAKALGLIHQRPEADWTIEALARQVGTSRAVLAERFARTVGETPIKYLSKWRMQRASQMLRETNATIETIANDVGYQSEAAFQRAFKKIVGVPPGEWRRKAA